MIPLNGVGGIDKHLLCEKRNNQRCLGVKERAGRLREHQRAKTVTGLITSCTSSANAAARDNEIELEVNPKLRFLGALLTAFFISLIALNAAFAANDPGHDSLYVLKIGDNVTGNINVTGNLTATLVRFTGKAFGSYLDLIGNGSNPSATTVPRIVGDSGNNMYIDSAGNFYLNTISGTSALIQMGPPTSNNIIFNVSGTIKQQNVNVCLQNGVNCNSTVSGANVTGSGTSGTLTKWTGGTSLGNSGILSESGNLLTVNGNISMSGLGFSIGQSANSGDPAGGGVAIGSSAVANTSLSTALGYASIANYGYDTALGAWSVANNTNSVAVGEAAWSSGWGSTGVGTATRAMADAATTLGYGTVANATYATALGYTSVAGYTNSVALGALASTTAAQQLVIGNVTPANNLNTKVFGSLDAYQLSVNGTTVCTASNGVCAAGGGSYTGAGAAGNITMWQTNSTNLGSSILYQTGGNIGVGTATAASKLTINGSLGFNGNTATDTMIVTDSSNIILEPGSSGTIGKGTNIWAYNSGASSWYTGLQYNNKATAPDLVLQKDGGNVGIFTTTPTAKLDINDSRTATQINSVAERITVLDKANLTSGSGSKEGLTVLMNTTGNHTGNILNNYGMRIDIRSNETPESADVQINRLYVSGIDITASYNNSATDGSDYFRVYGIRTAAQGNIDPSNPAESIHYGGFLTATGTAESNYGLFASAISAQNNIGVYGATTSGGTAFYATTSGGSGSNKGMQIDASGTATVTGVGISAIGGTANYGIQITNPASGASNYSIYSSATAQSYFAGNIGIGTTTPSENLSVVGNVSTGNLYVTGGVNASDNSYIAGSQICTAGNGACPTGTGNVSGAGTSGTFAKFSGGSTITNSAIISESGNTLTVVGNITMPTAFWIGSGAKVFFANGMALGTNANGNGTAAVAVGFNSLATGLNAMAVGQGSNATGSSSTSLGSKAIATSTNSIAIGQLAQATTNTAALAVGSAAVANGSSSSAFGVSARATGSNAIAIGSSTAANGTSGTAVGNAATAYADNSIALGGSAVTYGAYSIAAGISAQTNNQYASAYGYSSVASGDSSTAIGPGSYAVGASSIAIGASTAYGNYSGAFGYASVANFNNSFAIGGLATTTAMNQLVIGNVSTNYILNTTIYGSLTTTGAVSAPTVCIGGTCQSSWPSGGSSGGWVNSSTTVSLVNASNNITAGALSVDNLNSRVGIGTTTPGAALEIAGSQIFSQGSSRSIVVNATTSNIAGNDLSIAAGAAQQSGATARNGGSLSLSGGQAYNATGGAVFITSGTSSGNNNGDSSGAVSISTPSPGNAQQTGDITLSVGDAYLNPGNITIQSGLSGAYGTYGTISLKQSSQLRIFVGTSGLIGIGTNTPYQKLDVNGSGNFSGTNAQVWVNGSLVCTSANGLCGGGGGASGWLNNTNQVLLANNNTNVTVDNGNLFVDNTNNRVGIGTADPSTAGIYAKLAINGSGRTHVVITSLNTSTGAVGDYTIKALGGNVSSSNVSNWDMSFRTDTFGGGVGSLSFYGDMSGTSRLGLSLLPNDINNPIVYIPGNVGIGTATPSEKLSVVGNLSSTGAAYFATTGGYVGINTTAPATALEVNGGTLLHLTGNGVPMLTVKDDSSSGPMSTAKIAFNTGGTVIANIAANYSNGVYRVGIGANGVNSEQFSVLNNGYVGIGTITPTVKLAIGESGTGLNSTSAGVISMNTYGGERLNINGNTGLINVNNALYVEGSANVSVGTTNSPALLTVGAVNSWTNVATKFAAADLTGISNTANSVTYPYEFDYSAGNTNRLLIGGYRRGTGIGSWANSSWRIQSAVDNSFTTYNTGKAYIEFANWGAGGTNGYLFFGTEGADRLTIDNNGYVGIGQAATGSGALQIKDAGNFGLMLTTTDWTTTVGSALQFTHGATTGNTYSEIKAVSSGWGAWNNLVLQSGGGNVGIGTTNPGYKMQVTQSANRTSAALFQINDPDTAVGYTYGLLLENLNNNNSDYTSITNLDATGSGNAWIDFINVDHTTPKGAMAFATRNGGTYLRRAYIDENGNFGINTTAPSVALEVKGNINISLGTSSTASSNGCLILPGGGKVCGNSTCLVLYSPNGATSTTVCN